MTFKQLASGALFAAGIAAGALRFRALTRGGAVAAFAVGTLTFGAGGWAFTLILLAFFLPSVGLSRVGRARKKKLTDIGKGGARDAWQVLANGGIATACAVMAAARPSAQPNSSQPDSLQLNPSRSKQGSTGARFSAQPAWIAAFAGAYAAATADTWGTEIGTLARGAPRSILTLTPIPTGLSGGVTLAGSVAEIAGAAWLGTCALAALHVSPVARAAENATPAISLLRGRLFGAIFIGGIAGAFVDSLLGATVQELRHCPDCKRNCETNPHDCGTPTLLVRGIPGFSNDLVNFSATLIGAVGAFLIRAA